VAAHSTHYLAEGDQTGRAELSGARELTSWLQLAGVEVAPERLDGVLVAIGDSITDGSGSGRDRNERWTDYLVRRLEREGGPALGVINAGIGGNRLLADRNGPRVLDRFERDVLGRPGVTHALMLVGVNDLGVLGNSGKDTPEARGRMIEEIKAGWRQLAASAHARGVCLIAGTLTPYGASRLYKPQARNEADRLALNAWLRSTEVVDGVADFDAAVRDAAAPDRLDKRFDSGDGLHLSPAGFEAMAQAVPVERLARRCR
jgi:lysophospholipase L1-like esterase